MFTLPGFYIVGTHVLTELLGVLHIHHDAVENIKINNTIIIAYICNLHLFVDTVANTPTPSEFTAATLNM